MFRSAFRQRFKQQQQQQQQNNNNKYKQRGITEEEEDAELLFIRIRLAAHQLFTCTRAYCSGSEVIGDVRNNSALPKLLPLAQDSYDVISL